MPSDPEIKVAHYAKEKGEIVLRPHEYDGIQEYDQKMPNWWLFIFFGSVVFFLVWWLAYYQFGLMQPDSVVLARKMREIEKVKAQALQEMLKTLDDDSLVNKWARDETVVEKGRETFMMNCTACHGTDLAARMDIGGGQFAPLPGLSLVDGEWKYGSKPMDIFNLINAGTPADSTGHNGARMEAWGQKMAPIKIVELVAFVISRNPEDFPPAGN